MTLRKLALSTLLLIGIAAATVQAVAYLRKSKVEASHPPTGQMITVDGRAMHVDIQGPEEGRAVVLIHGASGSTRDMTFTLAPRLAANGFRVYTVDRPGMGYSDTTQAAHGRAFTSKHASPKEQATFLKDRLDTLGVTDPILVGHSFGGAVALGWGLAHPDYASALVLLGSPSNPWTGGLGTLYDINSSVLGGGLVVPVLSAFAPEKVINDTIDVIFEPNQTPDGYTDYIGGRLTTRKDTMRVNARQVNGLLPHVKAMVPEYPSITQPVEIVHGLADTIVPYEIHSRLLVDQIPNANLVTPEDAGHMPQHSHQDVVVEAIMRAANRSAP